MREQLGFKSGIVATLLTLGLYQFATPFNALGTGLIGVYFLIALIIGLLRN